MADFMKIWHTFIPMRKRFLLYRNPILKFRANIALGILLVFLFHSFGVILPSAQADLPAVGRMIDLSSSFTPSILKGIVIHPDNALKFDFIMYKGDSRLTAAQKKIEYNKLIKYFLASLAVPDQDQWVNLSPYEKDRIIQGDFGQTEMGRDLLAQDYILKQITASLIYPEKGLGIEFWKNVYAKALQKFGNTNIPVNTFNKVWIMPDSAEIYEKGNAAYIIKNHLKVMLEEDYLAIAKNNYRLPGDMFPRQGGTCPQAGCQAREPLNVKAPQGKAYAPNKDVNSLGSQVIRELILPALEKEVNEGKNFAPLRQVYSGMLLAAWYKRTLKESLLGKIYANKAKVKGIDQDPKNNEIIYERYLTAFRRGVFNYVKEEDYIDPQTNQQKIFPRKYFSGGTIGIGMRYDQVVKDDHSLNLANEAMLVQSISNSDLTTVEMDPAQSSTLQGLRNIDINAWLTDLTKEQRRSFEELVDKIRQYKRANDGLDPLRVLLSNYRRMLDANKNIKPFQEAAIAFIEHSGFLLMDEVSAETIYILANVTYIQQSKGLNFTLSLKYSFKKGKFVISFTKDGKIVDFVRQSRQEAIETFRSIKNDAAMAEKRNLAFKGQGFSIDNEGHLTGSIFNPAFIKRERELGEKTIVFDLNGTIGTYHKEAGKEGFYYLRPGIKEEFRKLKAAGYRLVLGTSGSEYETIQNVDGSAFELSEYFDLIIGRQNQPLYYLQGEERNRYFETVRNAYRSIGLNEADVERVINIYKAHNSFKDITLLGYKMIVDDAIDGDSFNSHPFADQYLYYKIPRFHHEVKQTGRVVVSDPLRINTLTQRIKAIIWAEYLKKMIIKISTADEEFNKRQMKGGKAITYLDDLDHGPRHAADLLDLALNIAEARGVYAQVDWKVLIAAIVLHDIFAYEDQNHAPKAEIFAREFLKDELTQDQIDKVVWAIRLHDKRLYTHGKLTPKGMFQRAQAGIEAQLLFDIDQLEAFGYKGIYRFIVVYARRGVSLDRIKTSVPENAADRFNSLYFPESKKIAEKSASYLVLRSFFEELNRGNKGAFWVANFIYHHQQEHPITITNHALSLLYTQEQSVTVNLSEEEKEYAIYVLRGLENVYAEQTDITQSLGGLIKPPDRAMVPVSETARRVIFAEDNIVPSRLEYLIDEIKPLLDFNGYISANFIMNGFHDATKVNNLNELLKFYESRLVPNHLYESYIFMSAGRPGVVQVLIISGGDAERIVTGETFRISIPKVTGETRRDRESLNAEAQAVLGRVIDQNPWVEQHPAYDKEKLLDKIMSRQLRDGAMQADINGGIDFNAKNLAMIIKRDGNGIPLPLVQQDMAQLSRLEGIVPRITEIKPASVAMFELQERN